MRHLAIAAMVAALLGGSAPTVSAAVLRGGGSWGAEITDMLAPPRKVDPHAQDVEHVEEAMEKPWLSSAVTHLSSIAADARWKVLLQLGFMHTMSQQPGSAEPHTVSDTGVEDGEELPQVVKSIIAYVSVMIVVALVALIAQYYLNHKVYPDVSADPSAGETLSSFRFGPFDCFSRMDICLWVFCCPGIRWADNVSTIGLLRSFWLALTIFIGFEMVTGEAQDLVAWTVLALIGAMFRQELRLKFQMKHDAMTFFQDCLLHCFCSCCAITQEARQVDEAMRLGHPAVVERPKPTEEASEATA